jgi:hypothetical protein
MRVFRGTIYLMAILLMTACVERYYPGGEDVYTGTLVINAQVTNIPGIQTIQISRSDGLLFPEFIPESNCVVEVESEEGDLVSFTEGTPGYYNGDVPASFMRFGKSYMLRVVTSDGNVYVSDYAELNPPTDINKVYFELETNPTQDPGINIEGIQFYIDFEIDQDSSEFMRWELVETYEFHNPDYQGYIYSYDRVMRPIPDSLSDRQCWIIGNVNDIYTLDVANMRGSEYSYMPLHFVSNETQRLSYGYSLLVRQHSLDEAAFRYWDELKKNSHSGGGLYDRLPSITPSNISNENDEEDYVLGFFTVSGVTEKRVFVKDVEGLNKYDVMFCFPMPELPRLRYLLYQDLPIYASRANEPDTGLERFGETEHRCLDCRIRKGSSGEAPDFWPID